MDRQEALNLVKSKVHNQNLIKHMLATEACMRRLAEHFDEDVEKWSLVGLLHDLDYDETKDNPDRHGLVSGEMLRELDVDKEIIYAIEAHPGHRKPESRMDWALFAVDPTTGLIVASTLMHPSKDLNQVDTDFVMRRFKEKRFAMGANRDQIKSCSQLGLKINDFIGLCLEGMRTVATELGLGGD
ncbi:MAG TPA: HDIG domain-containing protein [bacterium (Candidatus Stahlbacteria)]|nr:HDIG domain-containing protein [Candidatus Stahlbacteria bacterium]